MMRALAEERRERERAETARLVTRFQGGDRTAFRGIYECYVQRVHAYLAIALGNRDDAEEGAQEVFTRVFDALGRYEPGEAPFDAWLITIARNYALDHLEKEGRVEVEEPREIDRRRERKVDERLAAGMVARLSDQDLIVLIRRLPVSQRQVLALRYILDLPFSEIGTVLGRSHQSVRHLHWRACEFLRLRLTALGREPRRGGERPMVKIAGHNRVLRKRRFALDSAQGSWR